MLEKLISKEMTAALADVLANMPQGRRTAAHASLTDDSVEAFKAGYRDLKFFLKETFKSLERRPSRLEPNGRCVTSSLMRMESSSMDGQDTTYSRCHYLHP